jgi:hypothetical protein
MEKDIGRERRKYPRLNAQFVISYKIKQIPNNFDLSQTKNVSQGGVLLTTNRKFIPGTILTLTVKFPFVSQRINLTATVVDSQEVAKNLLYNTRLCFDHLDKKFFLELGAFIKKQLGP